MVTLHMTYICFYVQKWFGGEFPNYLGYHHYLYCYDYFGYVGSPQTTLTLLAPFEKVKGQILANYTL
jgi:hypothetical protein